MISQYRLAKIELTDRCNASCIFCSRKYATNTDMSFTMFKNIIQQLPNIKEIQPQFFGESLLHPEFINCIQLLKEHNKDIVFHTNGSLLKNNILEGLIMYPPKKIIFSIESDNKQDYEQLRRGLIWEEVLNNIQTFQKQKNPLTETAVNILATKEVLPNLNKIITFWQQYVDKVNTIVEMPRNREVQGRLRNNPKRCWQMTEMIVIKANGDIQLCCNDWNRSIVLGHVNEGIYNVLYNDFANFTREQINNQNLPEICRECDVFWEGV